MTITQAFTYVVQRIMDLVTSLFSNTFYFIVAPLGYWWLWFTLTALVITLLKLLLSANSGKAERGDK